jgi:hypothetical protein
MIQPIDPTNLPAPAQKIIGDGAPAKLKMMAAKGIVPGVKPDDVLSVLLLLKQNADHEVAAQARETLTRLPEPILRAALDGSLPALVIDELAHNYPRNIFVIEKIIRMSDLAAETVEFLAEHGDEQVTELVAVNVERILANPTIIEKMYMNKQARMSTINRLVELAVRNGIELRGIAAWKEIAVAIQSELVAAEPSDEPMPEDLHFWETDQLARDLEDEALEDSFYEDDDGEETLEEKLKPLFQRIAEMSVAEKVRAATLGTKEERMMLIREGNKVIARAAAKSPLMKESEVRLISRNRSVVDDVLRIIGSTPEFLKSYIVKKNLVENSKTPIPIAMKLIVHLREADLRKLAKDKNISSGVQMAARRHLERRKK